MTNEEEFAALMNKLRNEMPSKIAEELCSVQPMPSDTVAKLKEASLSEEELRKQGYKPVSRLGLMWYKET